MRGATASTSASASVCALLLLLLSQAALSHGDTYENLLINSSLAGEIMRQAKSAGIKSYMDDSVQPCQGFYNFTCGNFERINGPSSKADFARTLSAGYQRRVQQLLDEPKTSSDSPVETRVKYFYESCQQAGTERWRQRGRMLALLRELGGMPAVEQSSWNESSFDAIELMATLLRRFGKVTLLQVQVLPGLANSQFNTLYVGQREDLPRRSSIQHQINQNRMQDQLQQLLGLSETLAIETSMDIMFLDMELARSLEELPPGQLNRLRLLDEMSDSYGPSLNLTRFVQLWLGHEYRAPVYESGSRYLLQLKRLLDRTPKRILANYMLSKLLADFDMAPCAPKTSKLDKWCTEQSKTYFGMLTDHVTYELYRNPDAEAEVHRVWEEIRDVFRRQLAGDKLDWIANATRQVAIEKLDQMQLLINAYDKENFDELYGNLSLDSTKYASNIEHLLRAQARQKRQRLHGSTASKASRELSYTPIYTMTENTISIPVALLQPLYFWDPKYPQALRYATLGYMLAHEMIHGFDEDGSKFDAQGNLAPWWDPKSIYEFEEKRKCFQAQYHNYKYGDKDQQPRRDQSENIADNAGVKLAYAAYEHWLRQQPSEVAQQETLPGLELDNRQLFFLAFAQSLCDDVQSQYKTFMAVLDNHSPSMYRVIGSLSNFQEFSWVFKCPQRAKMDPEFKCAIY
ncbi:hypothetical protein KR222_002058 [Zaprionus bogoriensis]|nr:hypothetical protein KR222_002058 [Zaprionus bogoriensis]